VQSLTISKGFLDTIMESNIFVFQEDAVTQETNNPPPAAANKPRSIMDYIPDHVKRSAVSAVQPSAVPPAQDRSIPESNFLSDARVTLYGSLGSKHVGGKNGYPDFDRNDYASYASHYYAEATDVTNPTKARISGHDGKLNKPFHEDNHGASMTVMWPLAKVGKNGVIEGGVNIAAFRNSFGDQSTALGGGIAYRHSEMIASALGKTSGSVGVEIARVTGYEAHRDSKRNFMGQIYGEVCQDMTKALSVCLKVGVIPVTYKTAEPDKLVGTEFALRDDPVIRDSNYNIIAVNPAKPLPSPPVTTSHGVVVTKQLGLSWKF
jgi:hypothetical protein